MAEPEVKKDEKPGVETPPAPPAPSFEADDKGNVTVPLDVFNGFKNDMHKYKNERNELKTTVQDLTTKVNTFEDTAKAASDKKLLDDGEFKELAEKKQKEIDDLKKNNDSILINSEIKVEALKLGANNVNDVISLFDKSEIKINESGQIEGVSEAMKTFSESKPYLFGESSGENPLKIDTKKAGNPPAGKKYEDLKPSELMALKKSNPELYKSLEADYDLRFGTKAQK